MKETELFRDPIRYQLPIGTRPNTYAAVLRQDFYLWKQGDRVAVKGPFKSEEAVIVGLQVDSLKSCAPVSLLKKTWIQLEVDMFEETRTRIKLSSGWFLISQDLSAAYELPTKLHDPTANFPQGLEVVDWSQLVARGYRNQIPFADRYEDSIYVQDPKAAEQLVMHVLLDWVFGVGGDLALRNFIWPEPGVIYNVDVDNIFRFEWHLGNVQICKANHRMGKHFATFLKGFNLDPLRKCLKTLDWNSLPEESFKRSALDKDHILSLLVVKPRG